MILRFRFLIFIFSVSFLSSCFKNDDPIILTPPGDVQTDQVAMGPDYYNQIYYKLSTKESSTSDHRCWDLAFETTLSGFHIWLNSGNQIFAANTNSSNFSSVYDTTGANWKWDASSWNKDSTAIGDWINLSPNDPVSTIDVPFTSTPGREEEKEGATAVYLLDLGPDLNSYERFKKIVFKTVNHFQYTFKYANLDNSDYHEITLDKEPGFAYSYFSIRNGNTVVHPEPIKPNWDILFTRYSTILYSNGSMIHYPVNGVLINPEGYSVAIDSSKAFSDIDFDFAKDLNYKSNRDVIGYNWKHYSFSSSSYEVSENINYIIKDKSGYYWKLHFIGFYNDQGIKGYPQFEYQRL